MPDLTILGPPIRGRTCGHCTACCTWVPTQLHEGHKPAGTRCPHVRSSGCSIYARRPNGCAAWSCRWLFDPATASMRRPDRAGYIIDPMPDSVLIDGSSVFCFQVWIDPDRRDVHRDPALRAWIELMGERHGAPTIVRWPPQDVALVLIPPSMSENRRWIEKESHMLSAEAMADKRREARAGIAP